MSQEIIALLILAGVAVCLTNRKLSVAITLMTATCLMIVTGIISFKDAFSYFSSSTVWLMIALMVVGEAVNRTGIITRLGEWLSTVITFSDKVFIALLYLLSAVASWVVNALAVVMIFMAVADKVALATNGRISRKDTYYPIAVGASLGSLCSSVGSSAMMNVSSQLASSSYGRPFHLFEPFPVGIVMLLTGLVIYLTFGYSLQKKTFDFEEIPAENTVLLTNDSDTMPMWRKIFAIAVLVLFIVVIAFELIDTGTASIIAILLIVISGCIKEKELYKSIDWKLVFVIVGSLALGKGISDSGAGALIANTILDNCGALRNSQYAMCIMFMLVSTLLSNFMANNSAAAICVPVAFGVCQQMGGDMLPYAMACAIGVNASVATPICRTAVTMVTKVGYTFKHFIVIGTIINVLICITGAIAMYFTFFI